MLAVAALVDEVRTVIVLLGLGARELLGGGAAERGSVSYARVDQIRERFASLNPYDQAAVPGTILKAEVDAYCYVESKSADQDGNPCTRGTQGLLQRRPITAGEIVHIGKEANHLDRRAYGEVDADEATDLLLTYTDPANDPWRTRDLPRL